MKGTMKTYSKNWQKISANHLSDKQIILKIMKNSHNPQETIASIKMNKGRKRHFQRNIIMTKYYKKNCLL